MAIDPLLCGIPMPYLFRIATSTLGARPSRFYRSAGAVAGESATAGLAAISLGTVAAEPLLDGVG
jgi:hypothetical protein